MTMDVRGILGAIPHRYPFLLYEKDEGSIYTTQIFGTTEIFKLYNKNSGVHLYTESAAVKNAILAQFPGIWFQHASLGYGFEGPEDGSCP